jgi:hypothetical protein
MRSDVDAQTKEECAARLDGSARPRVKSEKLQTLPGAISQKLGLNMRSIRLTSHVINDALDRC